MIKVLHSLGFPIRLMLCDKKHHLGLWKLREKKCWVNWYKKEPNFCKVFSYDLRHLLQFFFQISIFVNFERKFSTCQILFLRIHFWNLILFEYLSKPLPFWEGSHANPSIVWWQYARPKSWLMIIWLISDPSKHPLLVVKMSFFDFSGLILYVPTLGSHFGHYFPNEHFRA